MKKKLFLSLICSVLMLSIATGCDNNSTNNNDIDKDSNVKENTNSNNSESTDGKYVIYLNDMKIILGDTTMDYIVKNTNLKVVEDSTSHSTCSSCDIKEGDTREITLSDGINNIIIKSYLGSPNKTKSFSTSKRTDDPDFDMSTGTKIVFVDNAIGKNINMGDTFTEDEYYNIYDNTGTCFKSYGMIQCSQTKLYANDWFVYWLDDNYKIINMSANLLNY